jgi:hypothetical protein
MARWFRAKNRKIILQKINKHNIYIYNVTIYYAKFEKIYYKIKLHLSNQGRHHQHPTSAVVLTTELLGIRWLHHRQKIFQNVSNVVSSENGRKWKENKKDAKNEKWKTVPIKKKTTTW